MQPRLSLTVETYFDLICPWCLIGKRHLDTALALLAQEHPDVAVSITWRSYPLLPDIPAAGLPFQEFYVRRLGSPAAVAARQAQVRAAAQAAGVTLAYERIAVMPSTLAAHRLLRAASLAGGPEVVPALIEELFTRYFQRGENIGDARVLRDAARACGIAQPDATADDAAFEWLPPLHDADALASPPPFGVPHFRFNGGHDLSGAQPPAVLLDVMRSALAGERRPSPADC